MYAVQYIAISIVVVLMLYVFGKYRRKEFEWSPFLFWEAFLGILLLISLFPVQMATEIKDVLGLGRGLDALFVVAIGLTYIIILKVYIAVDRTEREITELTRKIAIELEEMNRRLKELEEERR